MPKKQTQMPFQISYMTKRAIMPCVLSDKIYRYCDKNKYWCCWLEAAGFLKEENVIPPVPPIIVEYITTTITLTPKNVENPITTSIELTPN